MKQIYGVDVGGTSVKLGLFDTEGILLEKWSIPTRVGENGKYLLDDVAQSILQKSVAAGGSPADILAVGMGVPGPIRRSGYVFKMVNVGIKDINPPDELSRRLGGVPVFGMNDATSAAFGEYCHGSGQGCHSLFMITLGTGVGGGFVLDGVPLWGSGGLAGEIGHLLVNPEETEFCNCGKCGCLEQYASATGLVHQGHRILSSTTDPSILREIKNFDAKDILDAAKDGDKVAVAIAERAGRYLSVAIASIIYLMDPDVIVLGGGVSNAGEYLIGLVETRSRQMTALSTGGTPIKLATLGNDAGIIGNASLAISQVR